MHRLLWKLFQMLQDAKNWHLKGVKRSALEEVKACLSRTKTQTPCWQWRWYGLKTEIEHDKEQERSGLLRMLFQMLQDAEKLKYKDCLKDLHWKKLKLVSDRQKYKHLVGNEDATD